MIKFEKTEVFGWEAAIRGMRNPMNSWEKSDSNCSSCMRVNSKRDCESCNIYIGHNDLDLMKRLRNAGTDHRKFMRMITVYVDITAPLYWWKEFDTYRTGVTPNPMDIEMNSCSTMHKIAAKEFTLEDFSHEHLIDYDLYSCDEVDGPVINGAPHIGCGGIQLLNLTINVLNYYRKKYLETKDKKYWWQMIQLLPSSYNQKRTVMLNYEVLANIYKSRRNHKLDEWREHPVPERKQDPIADGYEFAKYINNYGLCDWIKTLPYSELITGETVNAED